MKAGFPHMGDVWLPMVAILRGVGVEPVVPPPYSKKTLSLGVRYSPEGVCIPFKLTLGSMIEALDLGADVIIMAAGPGLCRFGYYAKIQERVLQEQGYKFDMVTTELFEGKFIGVSRFIKRLSGGASMATVYSAVRLGLKKIGALDDIERAVHKVRPLEAVQGTATKIFDEARHALDEASNARSVDLVKADFFRRLDAVERNPSADPLKVGVIGEFYVVLEPFSNMDVEIELGKLGVEVHRTTFVSEWTKFSLFLSMLGMTEKGKLHKAAMPYLKRDVGGDGWETVGEVAYHAGHYDGLVHLAPFTCMPEIVAKNIIPSMKEQIPLLTIICDEQMGRAGMLTRLEAFVDLLRRRRDAQRKAGALAHAAAR
ncbi:MAG: CoA protein activase [Chloroflexi bacterium]|nr:CoA protein activase [Chloroflexota bacterium]